MHQGDEAQRAHGVAVLCTVLESLRIVAVGLKPVVPRLSERIYLQLGFTAEQFQVRMGPGPCRPPSTARRLEGCGCPVVAR